MHFVAIRTFAALALCLFAYPSFAAENPRAKAAEEKPASTLLADPASTKPLPASTSRTETVLAPPASSTPRERPSTSTAVEVLAPGSPVDPTCIFVTPAMIEQTAGAHEDPARFFQTLPGVVSDSDARNDFLVRGGNASENLFVIDNIDVHSISHLALSNTSGGFVSMIDNAAVQNMTLHTASYDAKFDDRLSSVVEISTIPDGEAGAHPGVRHLFEAGIAGVGGMDSRTLGQHGSLFISGREGILRFFTNDIGMNGVPSYSNNLVRGDTTFANGDKIWGLSLTGIDSINIHPDPNDPEETNPVDVRYTGWRNTTGFNWQHLFSSKAFGLFTLSNSEQAQSVLENDQTEGGLAIYNEQTHDGNTSLKSQFTMQPSPRVTFSFGSTETINRLHYDIAQPDGLATNPYDANPNANSATNVHRSFSTGEDAGYAQANIALPGNIRLTLAERAHHWAMGGHYALTPKASLSFPLGRARTFTLGYADYAQMPASLYLLSFSGNQALDPIRARHLTAAMTLIDRSHVRVSLAGYRKTYRDYPVSTQFRQLSLANVSDTFGQAFLMFPMVSQGLGRATGAELSLDVRPSNRLTISGNLAYSKNQYSGLDGVFRNGSSDIPLVANLAAVLHMGHGVTTSARYTATSGRPYTPDDLALSTAQDRDVYQLAQINAMRGPTYGRLDFRVERATPFRSGTLLWHIGLDNALNQTNFYSYQWQPNKGSPIEQTQMPIFPDGGVKYSF